MPRPNPSPQWQEPATTAATVAASRVFLALNPGGGYGITFVPWEADASFTASGDGIGVDTVETVGEGVRAVRLAGRILIYTL